jgi:hypothetical protein
VSATPSENELERLLVAAAGDPAERPAFSKALIDSDVYVLGLVDGEIVDGVVPAGASVRLWSIADDQGSITPFFTSERKMDETLATHPGADPRYIRLRCRNLFELTAGTRLVLNPGSPYGKIFVPAETAALADGRQPGMQTEVIKEERHVLVGAAAHIPPELPAVLSRYLVQRPVVAAAHLGWIAHPDGHTGYFMIVEATDREQALDGFGSLNIGEVTNDQTLDVRVVPPGSHHALSAIPAFYRRPEQEDTAAKGKRRWRRS